MNNFYHWNSKDPTVAIKGEEFIYQMSDRQLVMELIKLRFCTITLFLGI
jgi:hypothetical protein